MKNRRGCVMRVLAIAASLALLTCVAVSAFAFWYLRQQERTRAEFEPPTVFVTRPESGLTAPTGSYLIVTATAVGRSPITRVELWLDGELLETQESDAPEGWSPFDALFELLLPEGPHMIFVRAVNVAGMIGQSLPVALAGEGTLIAEEDLLQVTVEEDETWEDIATSYGTDPQTLQELNPDLGDQQPSPGTVITVPGAQAPPVGPSLPSTPPDHGPIQIPEVPPLRPIGTGPVIAGTIRFPAIIGQVTTGGLLPPFYPPAAPTDLQAEVKDCMVRLRWRDNAWNETSHEVWMARLGLPPLRIATVESAPGGLVWVEVTAPEGGFTSFWVEAANLSGRQPSNIAWVFIGLESLKCPSPLATRLQVEVEDLTMAAGYDKAYCFVSLEGAPHVRLPEDDSEFIQVQAGQGDITTWAATSRKFAIPIPEDESLEVAGECWGWSGGAPSGLGTFAGQYPRSTWDGTRRRLDGGAYQIGVSLQSVGSSEPLVTYGYEDPTLRPPYAPRIEWMSDRPDKQKDPWGWERWYLNPRLGWAWMGPQQITGFTIYLNGAPYRSVHGANVREAPVTFPALYDQRIVWQVAADAGEARSPLSSPLAYDLPPSPGYVMVKFDDIRWWCLSDSMLVHCSDCCDAFGFLELRSRGAQAVKLCANVYHPTTVCPHYLDTFSDLCTTGRTAYDHTIPDVLIVPVEADDVYYYIRVVIYDQDDLSASDRIAFNIIEHVLGPLEDAQRILGCGKQFRSTFKAADGRGEMWYTVTVFPNECDAAPPYPRQDWDSCCGEIGLLSGE